MTAGAFSRKPKQTLAQIFLMPIIIGVLSTGGLIFALVEDGIWDALSSVALGIPIVLIVVFVVRGRS